MMELPLLSFFLLCYSAFHASLPPSLPPPSVAACAHRHRSVGRSSWSPSSSSLLTTMKLPQLLLLLLLLLLPLLPPHLFFDGQLTSLTFLSVVRRHGRRVPVDEQYLQHVVEVVAVAAHAVVDRL
jgi:hypothetical protein